jgi:DNA-binding NtrC family response regulator
MWVKKSLNLLEEFGQLEKGEIKQVLQKIQEPDSKDPIPNKLISNQEAAEMLGCCVKTLKRKAPQMGLERRKIGRKVCYTLPSVINFIQNGEEK